MTEWRSITTAPHDRTIVGKISDVRFLCAWRPDAVDGEWCIKNSTETDDWALDAEGMIMPLEPEEWCEVP
jgi:hypothetical protein